MVSVDKLIYQCDTALKTIFNVGTPVRPSPSASFDCTLDTNQARLSAGLMRVNHVGEVCAQALYAGQALSAKTQEVKQFNERAASEEIDHLLWCKDRLHELHYKPSVLTPVWYAASLAMGVTAGLIGDKVSLGFVQETERQVTAHLHSHETSLPTQDVRSRAIVSQMKADEIEHAEKAHAMGAIDLPLPVKVMMRLCAKVMTTTAYHF